MTSIVIKCNKSEGGPITPTQIPISMRIFTSLNNYYFALFRPEMEAPGRDQASRNYIITRTVMLQATSLFWSLNFMLSFMASDTRKIAIINIDY